MNNILIAIPSKNRPENIKKYVLPFLSNYKCDYKIFIEKNNVDDYLKCLSKNQIVILEKENKGLGYALEEIKKYAELNNYDFILKCDDDVKKIGNLYIDLEQIIKDISNSRVVSCVVFPYKQQFYDINLNQLYSAYNRRAQTCYIIKTKDFKPDYRFSCFEDLTILLYLVNQNKKTVFCCKHAIDCANVGENQGGHQSFDRKLISEKELKLLKILYPDIGIREKKGKSWNWEPKLTKRYFSIKIKFI